jgi:hypothetical protein
MKLIIEYQTDDRAILAVDHAGKHAGVGSPRAGSLHSLLSKGTPASSRASAALASGTRRIRQPSAWR